MGFSERALASFTSGSCLRRTMKKRKTVSTCRSRSNRWKRRPNQMEEEAQEKELVLCTLGSYHPPMTKTKMRTHRSLPMPRFRTIMVITKVSFRERVQVLYTLESYRHRMT